MGHETAHHGGQSLRSPAPVVCRIIADLAVLCDHWHAVDGLEDAIHAAVTATAGQQHHPTEDVKTYDAGHITVVLADDARVQKLNLEFRGKNRPTNVLSFPSPARPTLSESQGDSHYLGDIILAYETIKQEAEAAGKPISAHVSHLVVHGILHLFGYDHETDADAEQMEAQEVRVLAKLNIENPYGGETHLSHDA